jgi:hypothetical protein
MASVAEFEHFYPGLFREGAVGFRYFWALFNRIPMIRARNRLDLMFAAAYGLVLQATGDTGAKEMLADTQQEAGGRELDPHFVRNIARMMEEPEWIARGYAQDEQRLRDLLLFHPAAEQFFPVETARVRAEWNADVRGPAWQKDPPDT